MKKFKMDSEALKRVFEEKYTELIDSANLPASMTIQLNPSVKLADDQKVEVWFRKKAYKKMQGLIDKCPKEIGWHGTVERTDEKHFQITDIVVFPQAVTGSTVTPDEEEYTQWLVDLAINNEEVFDKLRFHGHSHVNMGVSPSGVDTDYQKNMSQNIEDFYIFGIFNKKGEYWMQIWDIGNNILYEKDDIKYLYEPEEEDKWADEQIKQYVKETVYHSTTPVVSTGKGTSQPSVSPVLNPIKGGYSGNGYGYDDIWDDEYFAGYNGWAKGNRKSKKGYGGYNYD